MLFDINKYRGFNIDIEMVYDGDSGRMLFSPAIQDPLEGHTAKDQWRRLKDIVCESRDEAMDRAKLYIEGQITREVEFQDDCFRQLGQPRGKDAD